jgi:NADPH-dependent 2,4-dienoyl-CoA reductase/sulfur reductase-like enzyme
LPAGQPVELRRVAIVGASLAGVHAAQALRRQEFDGEIVVVGDEPHYPYDRPPLSKQFLAGTMEIERLRLRPAADPAALGVEWRLGRRATGLALDTDGGGGELVLDEGPPLGFDGLVIACGASPRPLPGAGRLDGVHLLRTLDDCLALRAALDERPARVLVIGAGFIGAEVAATARERGHEVTVVEAAEAPLTRVLDAGAGMAVAELHRSNGVDVRLGAQVAGLQADGAGRVRAVDLADGTTVEAPVVVVGIGVTPNTGWLDGSGLSIDDGVVADETCLAAPGVVVAGDVARWPNTRFAGRSMRVEQWDNAIDMGAYAGRRLLAWAGGAGIDPFEPVPWFWSDQYDRKIQLAGVSGPSSELLQGSVADQQFVQLYLDDQGQPCGALAWNRPRQAVMARQLIAGRASLDELRAQLS